MSRMERKSNDVASKTSTSSSEFSYVPASNHEDDFNESDTKSQAALDSDDDLIILENGNCCNRLFQRWNRLSLVKRTVVMCLIGFTLGMIVQFQDPSDDVVAIIGYPGRLFIRVLKLLVMPMIATSMALAPSQLGDAAQAKFMGKKVLFYYLTTTFLAAAEGLLVVNIFKPGGGDISCKVSSDQVDAISDIQESEADALSSILGIGDTALPDNLFVAFFNNNILGMIVFFLWFGFILMKRAVAPDPLIAVFDSCYNVLMDMIMVVIDFTPLGVFSLIAGEVSKMSDTWCVLQSLGVFVITVFVGLFIHCFFIYPSLYFIFLRKNPFKYYKGISQAMMTAFATSSSAATLPVTMQCAVENNNISKETASFMFPIGATVNMDGTAIYYPVAAIFVAAMTGREMAFGRQVVVAIISAFISIGSAPVPSAGLVYLIVLLQAVDVPVSSEISFILAVDWLIDRAQTAVNVCGDSIGAAIIDNYVTKHNEKHGIKKRRTKLGVGADGLDLENGLQQNLDDGIELGFKRRGSRSGYSDTPGNVDTNDDLNKV